MNSHRKHSTKIGTGIVFIVFCQIYYGFRYILQYNSVSTSPTYHDTPFAWQLGKYLIIVAYLTISSLRSFHKGRFGLKNDLSLIVLLVSVFFCYAIVGALIRYWQGDASILEYIIKLIIGVLGGWVLSTEWQTLVERNVLIGWIAIVTLWYHEIYEVIQITMYYVADRLPALAYEGGLVRFGGGWDDPNGFSVYLVLPLLYFLVQIFRRTNVWRNVLGTFLVLGMLLFTFSFSGYLAAFIAVVSISVISFRRRIGLSLFSLVTSLLLILFSAPYFLSLFEEKAGSMDARLIQYDIVASAIRSSWENLLFGLPRASSLSENFYLNITVVFGLLGLGLFLSTICGLIGKVVFRLRNVVRSHPEYISDWDLIGILFCVIFVIVNNFISFFDIFPINIFFWMILFSLYRSGQYIRLNSYARTAGR